MENVSVVWISFPFEDLVRTRDFPHANDCSVLSTSLSSELLVLWRIQFTQISSLLDKVVREVVPGVEQK